MLCQQSDRTKAIHRGSRVDTGIRCVSRTGLAVDYYTVFLDVKFPIPVTKQTIDMVMSIPNGWDRLAYSLRGINSESQWYKFPLYISLKIN